MIDQLHLLLAWLTVLVVAVTLTVALGALAFDIRLRRLLDGLLVLSLVMIGVTALAGLPNLVGGDLSDPLHLVYAIALPLVLVGGRLFLARPSPRDRLLVLGVWVIVLLGVAIRLFMTGTAT